MENPGNNKSRILSEPRQTELPKNAPLKLVVIAPFCFSTGPLNVLSVDGDSVDDVFAQLAPTASVTLPGMTPNPSAVDIRLSLFKQFQPKHLLAHSELFQPYLTFLEAVDRLQSGRIQSAEFDSLLRPYRDHVEIGPWIEAGLRTDSLALSAPRSGASPAAPTQASPARQRDSSLESLFDLVETGKATPAGTAGVDNTHPVIRGVTEQFGRPVRGDLNSLKQHAQTVINQHCDRLLHSPPWQELEACWRGLRFLIEHTDFRAGAQIEIIPLARTQLRQMLPEIQQHYSFEDAPICILAAYLFHQSPVDLEDLQQLAQLGEMLQVPILTGLHPDFFGEEDISRMHHPGALLQKPGYEKWQALRDKDCSRWLGVCTNRMLMRETYHDHGITRYTEKVNHPGELLWGNPVWVFAALIGQSHGKTGWPTETCGPQQQLAGIALTPVLAQSRLPSHCPLEQALTLPVVEDLSNAGVIGLIHQSKRDGVFCLHAQSANRGYRFEDKSARDSNRFLTSINYHLLLTHLIQCANRYKPRLSTEHDKERIAHAWQRFFSELLSTTGPGFEAQTGVVQENGQDLLEINLRTGQSVLNGVSVHLHWPL